MIEKLKESHGRAFGFKVTGTLTGDDIHDISREIDLTIAQNKHPIGIVADLSEMNGATWSGRWEEMRFLQRHTEHIARLAIVSNDKWEEIAEMTAVAAAAMQATTLYFLSSETRHAWHWARMSVGEQPIPTRVMYPGKGLFQDYTPDFPI